MKSPIESPYSEFNLRAGMKDNELWKELSRIGISGETSQEVQLFKEPELYHLKYENIPLHNVIMDNARYAIIGKSYVYEDYFGGLNETWKYFLAGINDEHKYFIRPIEGFEATRHPVTIQDVVDWVNRVDEGFIKRIQGDILIKYDKDDKVRLPDNGDIERYQHITHHAVYKNKVYQLVREQPIELGNHKLFCDGHVYIGRNSPEILIDAESIMIKHSEHQFVNETIPLGQCAILAPQRGRTFDLSNYLRRAFD